MKPVSLDNLDLIVATTLKKLGQAAQNNDAVLAEKIIKDLLLAQMETAGADQHRARLAEIGQDTVKLCEYWGELGIQDSVVRRRLGNGMNDEEKQAFVHGADARYIEARALEWSQAQRGGKVLDWMTKPAG